MNATWTTRADIAAKVRRRWADGSLLRGYAQGHQFEEIQIPVRGPKASEVGDDLATAREWVSSLDGGR